MAEDELRARERQLEAEVCALDPIVRAAAERLAVAKLELADAKRALEPAHLLQVRVLEEVAVAITVRELRELITEYAAPDPLATIGGFRQFWPSLISVSQTGPGFTVLSHVTFGPSDEILVKARVGTRSEVRDVLCWVKGSCGVIRRSRPTTVASGAAVGFDVSSSYGHGEVRLWAEAHEASPREPFHWLATVSVEHIHT